MLVFLRLGGSLAYLSYGRDGHDGHAWSHPRERNSTYLTVVRSSCACCWFHNSEYGFERDPLSIVLGGADVQLPTAAANNLRVWSTGTRTQ